MYILGIDGGGTKTSAMVADETGRVHMEATTVGSNPNTLQAEEFEQVMSGLLKQMEKQNQEVYSQLAVCVAGLAGVGESGRDERVAKLLSRYLPEKTEMIIRNDAYNALYSGTLGKEGIVQIAGTGSITFGINGKGKRFRSGGWGYLFDDAGSGFYLGNEALRAVFKAYDHRGSATSLTGKFLSYFAVGNVPEIIGKVYGQQHPRSVVAPLAPLVVAEATAGDEVAKQILFGACQEMMLSIEACRQALFPENETVSVVLSGGVFSDDSLLVSILQSLAQESIKGVQFCRPQVTPAGGAVIAGLRAYQQTVGEDFVLQLNGQLQN